MLQKIRAYAPFVLVMVGSVMAIVAGRLYGQESTAESAFFGLFVVLLAVTGLVFIRGAFAQSGKRNSISVLFAIFYSAFCGLFFSLSYSQATNVAYVVEDYLATISIEDPYARVGKLEIEKIINITQVGLQTLSFPEVAAHGIKGDFMISTNPRSTVEFHPTRDGQYATVRFDSPLPINERVEISGRFYSIDPEVGPLQTKENDDFYGVARVFEPVESLRLVMRTFPTRPCSEDSLRYEVISPEVDEVRDFLQPVMREDRRVIEWDIQAPEIGSKFEVECTLENLIAPIGAGQIEE